MQQLTDNPPKKPVASIGFNAQKSFLRKRLEHKLSEVESLRPTKANWAEYESVRNFTRRLRQTGSNGWEWVAFATCAVVVVALLLAAYWPKSFFYSYPTNYLRVIQRLNDSDFMVQRVEAGLAQETTMMRFCSDAKLPWFEAGHTLGWIRYDDHGSCQSIGPEDRGFDILRDANGMPVLPPNCRFDQVNNHIACEGGKPKF